MTTGPTAPPTPGEIVSTLPRVEVRAPATVRAIVITTDRLRYVLTVTGHQMAGRHAWTTPLGILLSLILTLCTATFKDTVGLKAATWEGIFVVASVVSAFWLVFVAYTALRSEE